MRAALAVAAAVLLAACGMSADEQFATDWWDETPPEEQVSVCLAYGLLGGDVVGSLLDLAVESGEAEATQGQVDAMKDLLADKCGQ